MSHLPIAPGVLRPAGVQSSHAELSTAHGNGLRGLRVPGLLGLLEARQRLLEASGPEQIESPVEPRLCEAGVDLQCPLVARQGLGAGAA